MITAHRGLASAKMFTDLNKVKEGDTFTVQVFDQVLAYQVRSTKVVEPEKTEFLRPEPGKDLITLITCTPLGVKTHRILVTAERITPTPPDQIAATQSGARRPGFPWWAVIMYGSVLLAALFFWRTGYRAVAPVEGERDAK